MKNLKEELSGLFTDNLEVMDYLTYFKIEKTTCYEDFEEYLENSNVFDVDIIYYSTAMEYLAENDASLKESLELANELGYSLDNLSSEVLASLHASNKLREDFAEIDGSEFTEMIEKHFEKEVTE